MIRHSNNARGSRKKSGKGEKNIREWEDQYPGRWILLQVTEQINDEPARGTLIVTASDPEEIQKIWKSHRKKGVLTMLTYGPSLDPGPAVVACAAQLGILPFSGLVAHTKKIKEKPDEIKRVIRAGIKANRYIRGNRDGTIPILMSTYRLDKEIAAALYDTFVKGFNDDGNLPEDGLRRLIEDTKTLTKVDRDVALSEVADLSILRQAQREMRIK